MKLLRYSTIALLVVLALTIAVPALAEGRRAEMAEKFRNRVQSIVQELREVANEEKGIGDEVSAVATEQEEIAEEDGEAMEAVEKRGKFRQFLFGTDYKNIGKIRRNMVRSKNQIRRLEQARERVQNEEMKQKINDKIAELNQVQEDTQEFVEEHEGKFSLLGWLMKRFRGGGETE